MAALRARAGRAVGPEYALLLDAIAPAPTPRAATATWDAGTWDAAQAAAEWHRLLPMLASHCATLEHVPAGVREALHARYLTNAARNLYIDQALEHVVAALHDAGVTAMALKGAALVETVYPDRALREMLDVDLLVPAERLDHAGDALARIGYAPVTDEGTGTNATALMRAEHHHDPALTTTDRIVAVELHHHIAMVGEREHFDTGGLWERGRPAPLRPGLVLPSPEDLLLHVCLHFMRNRLGGSYRRAGTGGALSQLADIAQIVAHETPDWGALAERTRAYRLVTPIFLALFAARAIGIAIPRDVLDELSPAGFDERVGRQLVELRVLRAGRQLPVRSLRFIVAPGHEVLHHGWAADPGTRRSLVRAYGRRAIAQAPLVRAALLHPGRVALDYRLNGRIDRLQRREQGRKSRAVTRA